MHASRNGRSALCRFLSFTSGFLRICSRRYFSSHASQSTAPIMPNGLRAVGRNIGIAPALTSAPWCSDLWLLRSNSTRSPLRNVACVTTLLDVDVPFSTKYVRSAPNTLRRVLLRVDGGADVNQQIAELDVGVAQVVAKDLLAEVLEEELPGRRLAVELPALVPGARERDLGFGVVGHEPAEERRQQAHAVRDDARDDLLRVERRRLLAEVDVAVDLARHPEHGHVGNLARVRERPERRREARRCARACASLRAASRRIAVDRRDVRADLRVVRTSRS